jgi:hypothetical protein
VKLALRALLVLAILAIGYLGVGLIVAAQLSAPTHHPQELTPTDVGLNYRQVSIQSTDGLEISPYRQRVRQLTTV